MSGFADGWTHGKPETVCGIGSKLDSTTTIRRALPEWVMKYGIKTLADAGAGDLNWIKHVDLGCEYLPFDVIARAPGVVTHDIRWKLLPPVDAILCRHVLNHMTRVDAQRAISLMCLSCRIFISNTRTGEWRGTPKGAKVPEGHFNEYDLIGDFNFGKPDEWVDDCRGQLCLWVL